jgi:hypothetical protein
MIQEVFPMLCRYSGLGVLDFAHVSYAAYLETDQEAGEYVDQYFAGRGYNFSVTHLDFTELYGLSYGPMTYQVGARHGYGWKAVHAAPACGRDRENGGKGERGRDEGVMSSGSSSLDND